MKEWCLEPQQLFYDYEAKHGWPIEDGGAESQWAPRFLIVEPESSGNWCSPDLFYEINFLTTVNDSQKHPNSFVGLCVWTSFPSGFLLPSQLDSFYSL